MREMPEVIPKSANVHWLPRRGGACSARGKGGVVGMPIHVHAVMSDGTEAGERAAFVMGGSVMAVWIVLDGAVQAAAPRLPNAAARAPRDSRSRPHTSGRSPAPWCRQRWRWRPGSRAVRPLAHRGARDGIARLRRAKRREFLVPFLRDPRLHAGRADDHGCRLRPFGRCRRAAPWTAPVGAGILIGRAVPVAGDRRGHAGAERARPRMPRARTGRRGRSERCGPAARHSGRPGGTRTPNQSVMSALL